MGENSRKLGRYELRQRIAKGGMGEIFLAKMHGAAGFEKNVIIKTILPHLAEEPEFVDKFLDEGRIVVQLLHGNIVPVFDMGEQDGEYFIAMEYVPGRDLREIIKRLDVAGDTFPVDLALYMVSEASKGLDYAHRKVGEDGVSLGLIHRDISPSNLLVSSEGEVKIIDFGIARAAGRLSKTVSGRIQGKFCYMSPEQASGKSLDARSDIFSLGATLYEMLTGHRPFEGDSDLESLAKVRKCQFEPPSSLNETVPPEVDAIVAKALAEDPDDRYTTAEKLQVDILQYLYSTGTSPTSSELATFLTDLFPEGLEREHLKRARGSAPTPATRDGMGIGDAMEALLAGHIESPSGFVEAPTATLHDSSDQNQIQSNSSGEPSTPNEPNTPSTPRTPSDASATPGTPAAVEDPTQTPESVSALAPLPQDAPRTRRWWIPTIALVILIAFMGWQATQPTTGSVSIMSNPEGARIFVDDVLVVGARTPESIELDEGRRRIRLELEGYEPAQLELSVSGGDDIRVEEADARLDPILAPRTFEVKTHHSGVEIWRDGNRIGVDTATVNVAPGAIATMQARKPGCEEGQIYPISYDHDSTTVTLPIRCPIEPEETPDPEPASDDREAAKEAPPGRVQINIRPVPEDANVTINGRDFGSGEATARFAPGQVLKVEIRREGYKTRQLKERASRLRRQTIELEKLEEGCLTLTLGEPQVGELSINSGPFTSISRGFKARPLAAGTYEIRLRNTVADMDETFTIDIEPGDECRILHVWPAR